MKTATRKTHPVFFLLTLAESEALVLFLAERERVWFHHAKDCGVAEPAALSARLVAAHRDASK